MKSYPETHARGLLTIENLDLVLRADPRDVDVGVQIAHDGRIWLCVNGMAFVRFKSKRYLDDAKSRIDRLSAGASKDASAVKPKQL